MPKTRIEYIDCLRGLLIIFVIYGHMAGVLDTNCTLPFGSFYLCLFFFISGLVSSTIPAKNIGGGVDWLKRAFISRFCMILLPSIAISTTAKLITGNSLLGLITSGTGPRPWFTFTLFFIFFFYSIIAFLLEKFNLTKRQKLIVHILISLICVPFHAYCTLTHSPLLSSTGFIGFFDFPQLAHYFPYFLMGVVAKIYNEEFENLLQNKILTGLIFAVWLGGIYSSFIIPQTWHLYWTLPILSTIGCFAVYRIFYQYQEAFSSQTIVGRFMSFLGKYTLTIYLLHFHFLRSLEPIKDSQLIEFARQSRFLEVIILTTLCLLISLFCILINRIVSGSSIIHGIFFGFNPLKTKWL